MRELRVLGALLIAGLFTVLAAGVAAGQTACAPSSTACNAPSARPIPSIPVVVGSAPQGPRTSTGPLDVLHRPPAHETASALPAAALACGVGVLVMTLGAIAHRRRPLGEVAPAPTRTVRVRADTVRAVTRERWDIEAVERAAAGAERN